MARAIVFLIGILALVGGALLIGGLADGTATVQRTAAKCPSAADGGRGCRTERSGYGIDDLALSEDSVATGSAAASLDAKPKKRSLTAKRPDSTEVGSRSAEASPRPDSDTLKSIPANAPRAAGAWRDPVDLAPAPAAKTTPPAPKLPAVPTAAAPTRTAALDDAEAPPMPAPSANPAVPARVERRAEANSATPARPEPAERAVPAATGRPKARPRSVARAVKPREAARTVASAAAPAPKPLDITPDAVVRRPLAQRAAPAVREPHPALAAQRERLRVAGSSPAIVPPRPIPDRGAAATSAFPPGFQSALRDYNARYSMFRSRGAFSED